MIDFDDDSWKKISGDRKFTDKGDFIIVVPEDMSQHVPLVCPVCMLMMRLATDAEYYRKHSCCTRCAIKWAEGFNADRWSNGWRPSQDAIDEERDKRIKAALTPRFE